MYLVPETSTFEMVVSLGWWLQIMTNEPWMFHHFHPLKHGCLGLRLPCIYYIFFYILFDLWIAAMDNGKVLIFSWWMQDWETSTWYPKYLGRQSPDLFSEMAIHFWYVICYRANVRRSPWNNQAIMICCRFHSNVFTSSMVGWHRKNSPVCRNILRGVINQPEN